MSQKQCLWEPMLLQIENVGSFPLIIYTFNHGQIEDCSQELCHLITLQMPNKIPFNVFWKLFAPTFGKTGQQYTLPFLQRFYTDQTRRVHLGSNTRMTSCRRNWTVVKRVTLSSPFRIWWISQNDIIETLWYVQLYPSNLQHWQHRDGYQQALLWEQ